MYVPHTSLSPSRSVKKHSLTLLDWWTVTWPLHSLVRYTTTFECVMGLSVTSKLEGECLGGCGVVVAQWSEHWQLKPGALGLIPGSCPDVFSSSKLSDIDGVMSSIVL